MSGAAPEVRKRKEERSKFETMGDFARYRTMGGATYAYVILCFWTISQKEGRVKEGGTRISIPR